MRAAVDRAFGVGLDFREAAGTGAGAGVDRGDGQGVVRRDLLGGAGAPAPAVLVTMSIGETVRARVGDAFPLPRELRTLGLRLDAGETLDLHALGILQDRDAARDLARRLGVLLGARDTRRALEAIGLGPLLERAKVTVDGARVRLVAAVAAEHRAATAEALRAIVGALRTGADPRAGGSW